MFDDHCPPVKEFCEDLVGIGSRFSKEFPPTNGKLSSGENVDGGEGGVCGLANRL